MPKIHFHLTESLINNLTWEEYEALERAQEGETKLYRLRPVLARFMADEHNQPIDQKVAMRKLAEIPVQQIPEIMNIFMGDLREAAVPKVSGGSSLPPSEPDSKQASESPDG